MSKYGVCNDTSSEWNQIEYRDDRSVVIHGIPNSLPSPTLNITCPACGERGGNKSFQYLQTGQLYSLQFLTENAVCQPETASSQQVYQWGFSVLQLQVTLGFLTIWTIGIWIMWLGAHLNLGGRDGDGAKYEVPRGLRAVLYLGDSIRKDFDGLGEGPEFLTDVELRRLARKQLRDGRVEIRAPGLRADYSLWRSAWRWFKKNYIWTIIYLTAWATCVFFLGSTLLALTMSFTMLAGWGRKTRTVVTSAVCIVGMPICIWVAHPGYFLGIM